MSGDTDNTEKKRRKKRYANKSHTQELYDLFVEAFRIAPGNISHASKFAGTGRQYAETAWEKGWTQYDPRWIPIRDYLAQERELVRAERARLQEEERRKREEDRERARRDAIEAQAQEARAAAQARGNAIGLAAIVGKLVLGCVPVADKLRAQLEAGANLSPKESTQLIQRVSYIVREANSAIRMAFEIERMRVGEPTTIVGLKVEDMAPEEMVVHLEAMTRTLMRAKALGGDISLAEEMEAQGIPFGDDTHPPDDPDEMH